MVSGFLNVIGLESSLRGKKSEMLIRQMDQLIGCRRVSAERQKKLGWAAQKDPVGDSGRLGRGELGKDLSRVRD